LPLGGSQLVGLNRVLQSFLVRLIQFAIQFLHHLRQAHVGFHRAAATLVFFMLLLFLRVARCRQCKQKEQ
jgi:hypothetical protein